MYEIFKALYLFLFWKKELIQLFLDVIKMVLILIFTFLSFKKEFKSHVITRHRSSNLEMTKKESVCIHTHTGIYRLWHK